MGPFIPPKHTAEPEVPRQRPRRVRQPPPMPTHRTDRWTDNEHEASWIDGNNIQCHTCDWETDNSDWTQSIAQWLDHRDGPVQPAEPPPIRRAPTWHISRGVYNHRIVCTCGWRTDSIRDVGADTVISQWNWHRELWGF